MKKILSTVVFIIILFCSLVASAASSGTCGVSLKWTIDNSGTLTISGKGDMDSWSYYTNAPWYESADAIRKVVVEDEVTSIGSYAFYNLNNLTSAVIGKSVTIINGDAFYDCDNLKSVVLSDGVTRVGSLAFGECYSLTEINLPDSITYLDGYVFRNCSSLTSITLPKDITIIKRDTFNGCRSLTTIEIPKGVMEIESDAFYDCESLVSIEIPDNVKKIGDNAFASCDNLKSVILSDSVKQIGLYAFQYCKNLTEITIPEGVTNICTGLFRGCSNLQSIVIPDSVVSIGDEAFNGCSKLTDITMGDNVTSIGEGTFKKCSSLTDISIPVSVTAIDEFAFSECSKLSKIVIPDSVTTIGKGIFSNCENLRNVSLSKNTTKIPNSAFENCSKLSNIIIPESVTDIEARAFYNCQLLVDVDLPNKLGCIGESAFEKCYGLTEINIPDSVTCINKNAFNFCIELKEVTIGKGVISIGNGSFYDCNKLTDVTIKCGEATFGDDVFANCSALNNVHITDIAAWLKIYFYNAAANPLTKAKNLCLNGEVVTTFVVPEGIEKINNYAFYKYSKLLSFTLSDSVKSIGSYAFYQCSNVKVITIGKGVTEIGSAALYMSQDMYVHYNGTEEDWNNINIESGNDNFKQSPRYYFAYVTIIGENKEQTDRFKWGINSVLDTFEFEQKEEHTIHLYTDDAYENEFLQTTPISENIVLYLRYVLNEYKYKFKDYDGRVIYEGMAGYGNIIVPPESPVREKTQQYTYEFAGWENYVDGITQTNEEMIFTAKYEETVNKYTYTFVDEDESVLKKETVAYGTTVIPPEVSDKAEYYVFDYWQNYTEGMEVIDDITFKAVYKYKEYIIKINEFAQETEVTYGENYVLPVKEIKDFNFDGYYTEQDGKGEKLTDESGNSIKPYGFTNGITVYPCYVHSFLNEMLIKSNDEIEIGASGFIQAVEFATDKEAKYLICTVRYPESLSLTDIVEKEFALVNIGETEAKDGYVYAKLTCIYDYAGETIPVKQTIKPFELVFDVSTKANVGEVKIEIGDITLIGSQNSMFETNAYKTIAIVPKLAEKIEISGPEAIDTYARFTAIIAPDYTTCKDVMWSVDNENVATISQDGVLRPLKNGMVVVKATTKDGSEISSSIFVEVTAYAKVKELDIDAQWRGEFSENIYEYTLYVKENVDSVTVRANYESGALFVNETLLLPGFENKLSLQEEQNIFVFEIKNVEGMTNKQYVVTVVKLNGSKTELKDEGKTFNVTHVNTTKGSTVILAVYENEMLEEMQTKIYDYREITFTTAEKYTKAKVMVWESISNLKPVCEAEILK